MRHSAQISRRGPCGLKRFKFAGVVAVISPEFVKGLFSPPDGTSLVRYAAAVGMVWGIFLGTAVMGFSLLLVTSIQVAKLLKKKSDETPES